MRCRLHNEAHRFHARLPHLSRAVFVNFELVESAIPPVGEVEDRHVEHKHWVVHSPVARECFSPFVREISSRSLRCFFWLPQKSLAAHFLSRVHPLPFVGSVVEQEQGQEPCYHAEHRTENSEPECDVPARVGDDIGFCLGHPLGFLVSYWPLAAIPKHRACRSLGNRSRACRDRLESA